MMAGVAGLSALVRAAVTRRRDIGGTRELRTLVDDGGGRTGAKPKAAANQANWESDRDVLERR